MAEIEIIPPEKPEDEKSHYRLTTVGDVKKQMADMYRKAKRGSMPWSEATRAIFVLRGMLKAIEVEQSQTIAERALSAGVDDAEQLPVFTGVTLIPPPQPKGKANGKANGTLKGEGED